MEPSFVGLVVERVHEKGTRLDAGDIKIEPHIVDNHPCREIANVTVQVGLLVVGRGEWQAGHNYAYLIC